MTPGAFHIIQEWLKEQGSISAVYLAERIDQIDKLCIMLEDSFVEQFHYILTEAFKESREK